MPRAPDRSLPTSARRRQSSRRPERRMSHSARPASSRSLANTCTVTRMPPRARELGRSRLPHQRARPRPRRRRRRRTRASRPAHLLHALDRVAARSKRLIAMGGRCRDGHARFADGQPADAVVDPNAGRAIHLDFLRDPVEHLHGERFERLVLEMPDPSALESREPLRRTCTPPHNPRRHTSGLFELRREPIDGKRLARDQESWDQHPRQYKAGERTTESAQRFERRSDGKCWSGPCPCRARVLRDCTGHILLRRSGRLLKVIAHGQPGRDGRGNVHPVP